MKNLTFYGWLVIGGIVGALILGFTAGCIYTIETFRDEIAKSYSPIDDLPKR